MSGKMPLMAITVAQGAHPVAPIVANAVVSSAMNELMILSFGFLDPTTKQGPAVEGVSQASAPIVAQVVIPRSSFRALVTNTMEMVKNLDDRDTFGWSDLKKLLGETK